MPTYEYLCNDCDAEFPVNKPVIFLDLIEGCPNCNSRDTRRKISAPTVIYNGDGFTKKVIEPDDS